MFSFPSKEAHEAALYDACGLIVETYQHTAMLSSYIERDDAERLAAHARDVLNQISREQSGPS